MLQMRSSERKISQAGVLHRASGAAERRADAPFVIWAVLSLLAILQVAVFDAAVIRAPDSLQVQYTPDDAYYYLTLARHFATSGLWTFDGGVSVTSGFHPLWAYMLSLLWLITRPTSGEFVRQALILGSLITHIALLLGWLIGLRLRDVYYYLLLTLVVTAKDFAFNSVSAVEWPLGVLFSLLYAVYFLRNYRAAGKKQMLVLFLIALGGSVARLDSGVFALALAGVTLVPVITGRERWERLSFPLVGAAGAVVGVLAVLTHHLIFTGQPLPSSALVKAHWASLNGPDYEGTVSLLANTLGIWIPLPGWLLPGGLTLLFLLTLFKGRALSVASLREDGELIVWWASALCIATYAVLYTKNGDVQPWYSANLIVPLFCFLWIGLKRIGGPFRFLTFALPVVVMILAAINLSILYPVGLRTPWPHQRVMLEAGKYLHRRSFDGLIGSWNAGIIGYYQGGTVVNLDGLVNNDVHEYAVNNRLAEYLAERNINYLIDFQNMFSSRAIRSRGGYDDDNFLRTLRVIRVFDEGEYVWEYLTLYRIER